MKTLKIGNIETKNNLILAPMAGITDMPFRELCKEQGCGLLYTEMVSAKAMVFQNKNTQELLEKKETEHPIAGQLFGSDPEALSEAAKMVEAKGFDIIDINMGCPVPKIVNNGEGSGLMRNPVLIGAIIQKVVGAVSIPVTVKIRKGFDEDQINAVEVAKIAESSGASLVAVHGRTRQQYYSGVADWNIIRDVKQAIRIPVVGNGDIFEPEDAFRMLTETGCDGLMIGRGAKGNPWLFNRILHYLETKEVLPKPNREEIVNMAIRHGRMLAEQKGDYVAVREMRKHISWYTVGFPNTAKLRKDVNGAEDFITLKELLNQFLYNEI